MLSDKGGWNAAADAVARRLAGDGTLVAGIDAPTLIAALAADGGDCLYPGGDLENLSHFAQAYRHLPTYLTPRLVGIGSGSALAYAILAQTPKATFGGALGLDFCARLALAKPLCRSGGLSFRAAGKGAVELMPSAVLGNPWIVLQSARSPACPVAATRAFIAGVDGAEFLATGAGGPDPHGAVHHHHMGQYSLPSSIGSSLPLVDDPSSQGGPHAFYGLPPSHGSHSSDADRQLAARLAEELRQKDALLVAALQVWGVNGCLGCEGTKGL